MLVKNVGSENEKKQKKTKKKKKTFNVVINIYTVIDNLEIN